MIVHCARALAAELRSHAARSYPAEACGLLVGRRGPGGPAIHAYLPLANHGPGGAFAIDPIEFLAAEKAARAANDQVLGVFHSHPDGSSRPSRTDRDRAWPEHLQLIASVDVRGEATIRAWRPVGGQLGATTLRIGPPVDGHPPRRFPPARR